MILNGFRFLVPGAAGSGADVGGAFCAICALLGPVELSAAPTSETTSLDAIKAAGEDGVSSCG